MLALCREHRLEHRTKHIALRYFLARKLQQSGQLRLAYVASQANTADIFTKALPPGDHQRFCMMLACFALLCLTGLVTPCSPPLCLWGFSYLYPTHLLVQSFLFLHIYCREGRFGTCVIDGNHAPTDFGNEKGGALYALKGNLR
ncbi:unnamed protein product [Closterium sp. NIES-53]